MTPDMQADWTAQVDEESKLERTYIVRVKVAQQDADLLKGDSLVPQMIRTTFAGTAIHVTECGPEH
jgi:hypothetical protein